MSTRSSSASSSSSSSNGCGSTQGRCIFAPFALKILLPGFLALLPLRAEANLTNATGPAITVEQQFEAANKLYEEKKYLEAVAAYQAILATGRTSAAIYFNLGNAGFKANRIGLAIAAYRKADSLTPRDPDVRANLQFARKQVEGPTSKPNRWQRLFGTLSRDEWTALSVGGVWLTFGLLALAQIRPALKPSLRTPTWAAGGATLLLTAGLATAFIVDESDAMVVVTGKEVTVRNGPLEESQPAFTAHDGAELRVTDHKDDWLQVTDGTRRLGWLKRGDVAAW